MCAVFHRVCSNLLCSNRKFTELDISKGIEKEIEGRKKEKGKGKQYEIIPYWKGKGKRNVGSWSRGAITSTNIEHEHL
jgi:hypothetical protein